MPAQMDPARFDSAGAGALVWAFSCLIDSRSDDDDIRYGEVLSADATRKMLRSRGVYPSRGEVPRKRVDRLMAIAAECPDLSKAGIVREYGKRYREKLSSPSTLATLRRLWLLGDR